MHLTDNRWIFYLWMIFDSNFIFKIQTILSHRCQFICRHTHEIRIAFIENGWVDEEYCIEILIIVVIIILYLNLFKPHKEGRFASSCFCTLEMMLLAFIYFFVITVFCVKVVLYDVAQISEQRYEFKIQYYIKF